jgi:hypothetical protein
MERATACLSDGVPVKNGPKSISYTADSISRGLKSLETEHTGIFKSSLSTAADAGLSEDVLEAISYRLLRTGMSSVAEGENGDKVKKLAK